MRRNSSAQKRVPEFKDPPSLAPEPAPEEVLDVAVEETFPASHPIAIEHAFESARRRERKIP
jgi:hypothetical protein